jgi:ABC-2 type transport system ATP-binding protein
MIGLVPQELTPTPFETVWATVELQPRPVRQAANRRPSREVLKDLSLWDKRNARS